jgi:sugar phosphate isomerase/epimerase
MSDRVLAQPAEAEAPVSPTPTNSTKVNPGQLPVNSASYLPLVGAAMLVAELPYYGGWIMEAGRDLELQDPAYPSVLDGDWQATVRQAKSILDGHSGRIGVHGPFVGLNLIAGDPKVRTVVTDRLRQGIDFAQAVGGTHMVMHSPFQFFGHHMLAESPAFGLTRSLAEAHKTLDPVIDLARQAGITLVIETIHDTHVRPLLALIDAFAADVVRLSIDVGHAFITHQSGGPSPDQWVREGGNRLAHLHLQDTDGLWDRHWGPGHGQINWFALFEALGTVNSNPRLILELSDKRDLGRAAQWLAAKGYTR